MTSKKSPHEALARRYPIRTFDGSASGELGSPPPWHSGDTYDPSILGWLLSMIVSPGANSLLQGTLRLRFPTKDIVAQDIAAFSLARGGIVFIPWPFVNLQIVDANTTNTADSTASVSFWPVFRSDPFPTGISSVLYGRTRATIPGGLTVAVSVPSGATGYRIMPAGAVANPFTVQELGSGPAGPLVYSQYRIAPVTTSTAVPGTEIGEGAWRETPPGPGARIDVTGGVAGELLTVFWKYELGALR
jgi:hypothetical protein